MEHKNFNSQEFITKLGVDYVINRTYHFLDWVDGNYVDEMINAVNRDSAIEQMKVKYPNHDFVYICELS